MTRYMSTHFFMSNLLFTSSYYCPYLLCNSVKVHMRIGKDFVGALVDRPDRSSPDASPPGRSCFNRGKILS